MRLKATILAICSEYFGIQFKVENEVSARGVRSEELSLDEMNDGVCFPLGGTPP